MGHRVLQIVALICLAALLLTGCSKDNIPELPEGSYESQLTYGVLEAEKLSVLPWNSGRCETTTGNTMVETEIGYYLVNNNIIYYADKVDLSLWVPLCNLANCVHYDHNIACKAIMDEDWLVLKDGRLYFAETPGGQVVLPPGTGSGDVIVSTALDGTDKRIEYVIEDAMLRSEGIAGGRMVGGKWMYRCTTFDLEGHSYTRIFVVDENGERELPTGEGGSGDLYPMHYFSLYGDPYFQCTKISQDKLLCFQGDELVGIDMKYVPDTGGFISGDTLRIFKGNRGYFDINVTTGKQVKVTGNRIKNSTGMILAANCILETNHSGYCGRNISVEGKMEVFDGESWRSVQLPEEWSVTSKDRWMHVAGMTSDSILVFGYEKNSYYSGQSASTLYRIPLDSEELVLEKCFTFALRR